MPIYAPYMSSRDPQARLVNLGGASQNTLVSHPNLVYRNSGGIWADSFMLPKVQQHNPTTYQDPSGRSDTQGETLMNKITRIFKMIWAWSTSLAMSLFNLAKKYWPITAVIILALGAWYFGVI